MLALVSASVGAVAVSVLAYRLARRVFTPGHIALFAVAGVLGWAIVMRVASTHPDGAPLRLATAAVGTAWFVLIREALRTRD